MLGWVLACAPAPELLLDPDPARDGRDGAEGPYGAARLHVRAAARVDDVVPVDLVYPADADGAPAIRDAPALVFVHGGFVDPDRYAWLAAHAASRGWAVALPEHPLHLALLTSGDAEVALAALRDASDREGPLPGLAPAGPVVVAGHSLGGVVAGNWFLADPEVDAYVALASWPSATPDPALDRPTLALVGDRDGSAPPDEVAANYVDWPGPLFLGEVAGMTHYAWTDDVRPSEARRERPPVGPVDVLRRDALRVIDAFLDDAAGGPAFDPDAGYPGLAWR
jgi:hypothetical protein